MKSRRWFVTPELTQWRYMAACGDYAGPFFTFPNDPNHERLMSDWIEGRLPFICLGPAGWTPTGRFTLTDEGWKEL